MTEREHALWCRVADHSKRRRWYVPADRGEQRVLAILFNRGHFQRRRADGAYRLFGLWPRPYRWPSWMPHESRSQLHFWWPPYWPANASKRRVPDLEQAMADGMVLTKIEPAELLPRGHGPAE